MGKLYKITMVLIFILPLIFFSLLFFIKGDRDFSESENRALQTLPEFSTASLFQGRYTKKVETYISDQFPFRDEFVAGKTSLDKLLLKKEGNGVYFGEDGYLLQKLNLPSESQVNATINSINTMAKKGYNVSLIMVPSSTLINDSLLPRFVAEGGEEAIINRVKNMVNKKVNFVDLIEPLKDERDKQLYYKTDHHQTSLGSYLTYREYMKSINRKPHSIGEYTEEIVTKDFLGSLYSKVLDIRSSGDAISLHHLNSAKYQHEVDIDGKIYSSLYFRDRLKEKDKYKVFLNDNYPYIKISGNPKAKEDIIIIKDSYANSLIPFLSDHYRNMYVVDPRYYSVNLDKFIEKLNTKNLIYVFGIESLQFIK